MRTMAPVAFAAISGVVLWKLFATLLLPVLGILLGLFATVMKLALIAGVIFFVYSMVKKRREEAQA
jgi:4-hydroxybenzoate polyprenyltransferase